MAGEFIYDYDDGSVTIVAFGPGAPKITGSFSSYEQFVRLNADTKPKEDEVIVAPTVEKGILEKFLGRLGINL